MGVVIEIAKHWFDVVKIDDDLRLITEPYVKPLIRCNIWHVRGRDRDLLVDTGIGVASLREAIKKLLEKPVITVATHTHSDHIGSHHEFDCRVVHPAEAEGLTEPEEPILARSDLEPEDLEHIVDVGYAVDEELLAAYPDAAFDPSTFRIKAAPPTWLVNEGDVIDLGDKAFQVMHLPGHSPGSIGLWDEQRRSLFSGDAIYDGPLLDRLPGSNQHDYLQTMERLSRLPVETVFPGHEAMFGRERLKTIASDYIATVSKILDQQGSDGSSADTQT